MFSFLQIFIKKDFSKEDFNPHTLPDTDIFNFNDLENFLSVASEGITLQQKNWFSHTFNTKITAKRETQEKLTTRSDLETLKTELGIAYA